MAERVIPLVDQRFAALAAAVPAQAIPATGLLADRLGRPLRDLRISVTDRCNFRCSYCMPKEVFDKDYPYLPHCGPAELRGNHPRGTPVRGPWRAQDPPDRRRAAAAQEHRGPDRATGAPAHRGRRAAGPDADHQRLAAGAQGPGAEGRRPAARHGQPGRAGRRRVPPHERRRLSGGRRARGHRRGTGRGAGPDQDQHGGQARHQRARDPADGAPLQGHATWCCASSSTWTWAPPTAGAWTRCCRRPRW